MGPILVPGRVVFRPDGDDPGAGGPGQGRCVIECPAQDPVKGERIVVTVVSPGGAVDLAWIL
jgi:hypothetical protein